jgi:hypothetical protein
MIFPSKVTSDLACGLTSLCGKPVTAFLERLSAFHPEIARIRFETYSPAPGLSARLNYTLSQEQTELRDAAQHLADAMGIPFWDALLSVCMHRGMVPEEFVDVALIHGPDPGVERFTLERDQITADGIQRIFEHVPEGRGLLVCSRVPLDCGEIMQLPMLDFLCACSEENAQAIRRFLAAAGQGEGILVESGNSYHFYGTFLLSVKEWVAFMARSLLFGPVVDVRYVGHRLLDGECRLKVFDSERRGAPKIAYAFSQSR